jgi:membrane protein
MPKPSRPTQIRKQTWRYLLRRTLHEFVSDGCVDAAAGLTFFAVLAVFPAMLAVVAVVGVVGGEAAVLDRFLSLLDQIAPGAVTDVLRIPLTDVAAASTAGFTLIISVATALWSASIYVSAFGRAMNRIYDVGEGRPYWKRKPVQLGLTVGLLVLVIVVGAVVVLSGPIARAVGDVLNVGDATLALWDIGKWPFLGVAVVMMVIVLYKGTGNLHLPRLRWLSLGALLAIAVMGLASAGFAFYIANFANYNQTFGTLTGVIIFLIWVFLINLALLLGAEFNAELERGRQLQAGVHAETSLQLPARDTTLIDRREKSARLDETRGTLLRSGEPLRARTDTTLGRTRRFVRDLWEKLTHRG